MAKTRMAQFTGPQLGLTTIGDYVYAYSGQVAANNTGLAPNLSFTTGNDIIVGKIVLNGNMVLTDEETGSTCLFSIYFNDQVVMITKVDTLSEDTPASQVLPFLIPPLTSVLVSAICSNNLGNTTVSIVGKHYK